MFTKTKIQINALNLFLRPAKEFLLYGGSRSSKTFTIVYTQILIAVKFPGSRHLIARFRYNAVKSSVWNDTLPKVLKICFNDMPVKWNGSDHYIELSNKSQIWIAGLDDAQRTEKILGMEFLTIFLNEASQISFDAYSIIKTRLAQKIEKARNILFIDENPPSKKHWTYKIFIDNIDPEQNIELDKNRYASMRMNPIDNIDNISKEYMEILESMPLRKRQRFKDGLFSDATEGALWTDDLINGTRVKEKPTFKRIIVSIDPAVTSKDTSDEVGLMVAGIGFDDHFYLLEDLSDILPVSEWSKIAVSAYYRWGADRIVAEVNNGGDLVEAVIRQVDKTISYKSVHATRDKLTRAEPVAALYEQGRAHHVGQFLDAELEMTSWSAKQGEKSPNRIDALVWAATELVLDGSIYSWSDSGWGTETETPTKKYLHDQ
jgi:phage terminase large subunit-like protein